MSADQFIWSPTQASKSTKPSVYSAKFGDGYEQNSPKGINFQPATWSLQFKGQTLAIAQAIDAFLIAQGGYLKFTWTPPGSAQCLWLCKQWQLRQLPGGVNDVSATFIQQFGI
ncbi:phage tail protein [Polynucleobacter sp. JS-Safj-400b-B2]|uniref:phage tail protein n=1 Tax=Polynucleobacter sp. JS-Safj-400b-B2 TaxID=2576921 RepID=UPI001C0D0F33|nr:phage tail protein [Polynucleobacter sp. JS-Safj-400b-B2]MBU3627139.1 phage tail protein [Polynucleobacter sp. JS-Safj-400b-B2]